MPRLNDQKTVLFVAPLYEDLEFWYPYLRPKEEGAEVVSIGPERTTYTGKHGTSMEPDEAIDSTRAIEFDALIIPGGYAPDHMCGSQTMVEFVSEMNKQRKPIAAICHGPGCWRPPMCEQRQETYQFLLDQRRCHKCGR
jgi:protease I